MSPFAFVAAIDGRRARFPARPEERRARIVESRAARPGAGAPTLTGSWHPEVPRIQPEQLRLRSLGVAQVGLPRVELLVGTDGEVERVRHVFSLHVVARQAAAVDG